MTINEFDKKLSELNLKKMDFEKISNVSKGTIYNWGTSRTINGVKQVIQIPNWVESFLKYYEKSCKYDEIKRLLKD